MRSAREALRATREISVAFGDMNATDQINDIQIGHAYIKKHQRRLKFIQRGKAARSAVSKPDTGPDCSKQQRKRVSGLTIIINHQSPERRGCVRGRAGGRRFQ